MYRKLPPIQESAEDLRRLMRQEAHPKKRERLQMLYLLQSGQATSRQAVARQLGVNRETVGRWLDQYADGGLAQVLDLYVPAGRASACDAQVLADLQAALETPKGFASYEAIRIWLFETHGVEMTTSAVGNLVRARFGGKAKVPRPTPKKTTPPPSPPSRPRSPIRSAP